MVIWPKEFAPSVSLPQLSLLVAEVQPGEEQSRVGMDHHRQSVVQVGTQHPPVRQLDKRQEYNIWSRVLKHGIKQMPRSVSKIESKPTLNVEIFSREAG